MSDQAFVGIGAQCHVCHGKKIQYVFSIEHFRVEQCMTCGLKKLNPQPTDEELSEIYGPNYFPLSDNSENRQHAALLKQNTAESYLNELELYNGGSLHGKLLEVGCGQGDFLYFAKQRGLEVTGVEYSPHSADIARKKVAPEGKVLCGIISQLLESGEKFDYIVYADVLEHVRDPRSFLKDVHKLLNVNGVSMAIVPSLDSFSARWMKNRWMEFKPEHLWYFSKHTLMRLFYDEEFGSLKFVSAKKSLSIDYIAQHFKKYPVRGYSSLVNISTQVLPRVIRRRPIRVTASGVIMLARKKIPKEIKKLSVVMPVYNEVHTVKQGVERVLNKKLPNAEIELIIVESGSIDGTKEIVKEFENRDHVKVIWQDHALGKGNAVREGLKKISGDFVMIQDADDEYDIEDYDVLLEPLMSGEADFVLGARHGGSAWKMRQFENQKFFSHFLNFGHWFFTMLVNVIFRLRLKDPFTMYKVFRADCLEGLHFECNRFDFDYELLIKLARKGYIPIEIPVNYRSRSFKEGKKVRMIADPLTWMKAIIKFRFQKI